VTSATSGIGLAVCRALARDGFALALVGRDRARCGEALAEIRAEVPGVVADAFAGDLMQRREALRVGQDIAAHLRHAAGGALWALINNAGLVRGRYMTTEDGCEQQFAANYLAGFLLTHKLLPALLKGAESGGGRVLFTSSGSHRGARVHWDDVMLRRGYGALTAYKQSKLCNVLFAQALNTRCRGAGIRAYAVDPGLVRTDIGLKGTGGLVSCVWRLRMRGGASPDLPAETYRWLCAESQAPQGLYFYRRRCIPPDRAVTEADALRLFALSEKLCGIEFGRP
jgi:NAD(P)-dependent dehydrogenase (short-subunit alcohol dehydrogenase family)